MAKAHYILFTAATALAIYQLGKYIKRNYLDFNFDPSEGESYKVVERRLRELKKKLVCNKAQSNYLIKRVRMLSSHMDSALNSVDEKFTDLLERIYAFLVRFLVETYVVQNWMNNNDSDKFNGFHQELDILLFGVRFGNGIQYEVNRGLLIEAKRKDFNTMIKILKRNLKEHESISLEDESRIMNDEITKNVQLLRKYRDIDTISKSEIKLRLIDTSQLSFVNSTILGEGSFGITHSASLFGVKVAVKKHRMFLNNRKTLTKEEMAEEVYKEALGLQAHNLPGVIRFYGVDDPESPTMIVMEAAVCSLFDWLYKAEYTKLLGELTFDKKVRILYECCCTFEFLHNVGAIHRDIKPSNILIMSDGRIKVTDFGLTQHNMLANSTGVVKPYEPKRINNPFSKSGSTIKGTTPYMAPELVLCTDRFIYNESTDMYSFAIMMNEVLTGGKPFVELKEEALYAKMQHTQGKVRPPLLVSCDCKLCPIIEKCWDIDPEKRLTFRKAKLEIGSIAHIEDVLTKKACVMKDDTLVHVLDKLIVSLHRTGFYEGQLKGNLKHGAGRLLELNGDVYNGSWFNDKRQLYGIHYENGDSYHGNWHEDKKSGHGFLKQKNGDTYKGDWFDDLRHGNATWTTNNMRHIGYWDNGRVLSISHSNQL